MSVHSSMKQLTRLKEGGMASSIGNLSQNSKLKHLNEDNISQYSMEPKEEKLKRGNSNTNLGTLNGTRLPHVDQKYLNDGAESEASRNLFTGKVARGIDRQYTWNQSGMLLNRRAQADHEMRVANILEELEGFNGPRANTLSQAKLNTTKLPKLDTDNRHSRLEFNGMSSTKNNPYKKHEEAIMRELNKQPFDNIQMTPVMNQSHWEENSVPD